VPAASPPADGILTDDELTFDIRGDAAISLPSCRVVLRRTAWSIHTALLQRQRKQGARRQQKTDAQGQQQEDAVLRPQMRAALLWYGWKRYRDLAGLKRFTAGLSGSDVVVFQPLLLGPAAPDGSTPPPAVEAHAWGSFLVVKTGVVPKIEPEWRAFRDLVADRAHPFMGRCEAYLDVQPAGVPDKDGFQATLVGSFLGGDLLRVESLKSLVRGPDGVERCLQALEKLINLLAPWYAGHEFAGLRKWDKVFRPGGARDLLLFGKYDWAREDGDPSNGVLGRRQYTEPLSWDVPFIKEEHLSGHLLGHAADAKKGTPERPGLLHRLRDDVAVRFSLTHGDLHPENILAGPDNVWLLDFGETGDRAPTLYDFTKLEVYLRLWCLDLSPAAKELDQGAAKFEKGLLDVLLGIASKLEAVDELAVMIGAQAHVLRKVADCITWLRRRAAPYTQGSPDRQDYLAVLYLTVLQSLRYVAGERDRRCAAWERDPLPNYRLLVTLACLLEDVLSRLLGLDEFPRGRESLDYKHLVTPQWLAAPGAPARIAYLMRRPDGRKALPFLAATRGVLQNAFHHLDVFDHTLLVMANLEELLRDPLRALCQPAEYERRVARRLRRQGLRLTATRSRPTRTEPPCLDGLDPHLDSIQALLDDCLDEHSRFLLKWLCLLHDIGKPASRCVEIDEETGLRKVQFRGHEAYSAFLADTHLRHWFPDEGVRARLKNLIAKHHFHHQRMTQYLGDAQVQAFDKLRLAVLKGDARGGLAKVYNFLDPEKEQDNEVIPNDKYVPDVPLLLLHGFADVAACAGPESGAGLGKVAELDLLLLAACARFREVGPNLGWSRKVRQAIRKVLKELGVEPGERFDHLKKGLSAWVKERYPWAGRDGNADGPTDEALRAEAERIDEQLRGRLEGPNPYRMVSLRFNYNEVDWQFAARILDENSRRLSRTRGGTVDTSTSPEKQAPPLEGEALRRRAAENEQRVQKFLFESRNDPPPRDGQGVLDLLWQLADWTNAGLLTPAQRLRTWSSPPQPPAPPGSSRVAPEGLAEALRQFADEVHRRWPELATDPVPLASWAEWELNGGSLHPFYDGCGRISRGFGALLLLRASWLLPLYEDRDTYFARGHQGPDAFAAYVAQRIKECQSWLQNS
jgi:hypothetical protein